MSDILELEMLNQTELGKKAQIQMDKGEVIGDDIINNQILLKEY